MKKLIIALLMAISTITFVSAEEPEYVTKWQPLTEVTETHVTFSHNAFMLEPTTTLAESYTLRVEVNNEVLFEEAYTPNSVVGVEYDNTIKNDIKFTLWAHYPNGQPFVKHQLGLKRVFTDIYVPPFDWNWTYEAPTCEGLKVTFPVDLPHDAIDINVRVKDLITGEVKTFNFRDANGFEKGVEHTFTIDLEYFEYQWVQVHGTNYHWEGSVVCGNEPVVEPPVVEPPVVEPPVVEPPVEIVPEEPIEVPEVPVVEVPIEVETLPATGVQKTIILPALFIGVGLLMLVIGKSKLGYKVKE